MMTVPSVWYFWAFLVVLMWNEIILNIEEFFKSYKAICIFVEDSIK